MVDGSAGAIGGSANLKKIKNLLTRTSGDEGDDMTRREGIKLHREMWRWLAENPDKNKHDWPRWGHNGGDIDNDIPTLCFACKITGEYGCKYNPCVFVWRGEFCTGKKSEFWKWFIAKQDRWRTYWAKKIAELPVRKKIS